eukprot:CAMPEP_0116013410 /NCGR_PEP_ID=MMETSP0321-20121206/5711_1 /TAXON_ID=163516 /ORGANISM="Leptocylindrus danicus var. danicus, Strain B650" /LENGTH=301 /DNA_ID=CAMNT_0003482957 /DNA_START=194 /DNA_END=1099 /DNA_ORIENTATION=-
MGGYPYYPLHMACMHSAPKFVIDALLEAAPEIAMTLDKTRNLPLHYACWNGVTDEVIVKLLVAAPKAARQMSFVGNLPLHCAIIGQSLTPESLELLIRTFPKALTVQNSNLKTPLEVLRKSPSFAYKQRYLNLLQKPASYWHPVQAEVFAGIPISEPPLVHAHADADNVLPAQASVVRDDDNNSASVSAIATVGDESMASIGVATAGAAHLSATPVVAQTTEDNNYDDNTAGKVDISSFLEADRVASEQRMLDEFKRQKELGEADVAVAMVNSMPSPPKFSPQSMDMVGQQEDPEEKLCAS